jgi:hypothetical protein
VPPDDCALRVVKPGTRYSHDVMAHAVEREATQIRSRPVGSNWVTGTPSLVIPRVGADPGPKGSRAQSWTEIQPRAWLIVCHLSSIACHRRLR